MAAELRATWEEPARVVLCALGIYLALVVLHCVVLERNGAISVVRRGEEVDPWLLADVSASGSA